jgi:hypothetical protein
MNKSTLTFLIIALALGLGSIYAVAHMRDSNAVNHSAASAVVQGNSSSPDPTLRKSKDAVNIHPFGK